MISRPVLSTSGGSGTSGGLREVVRRELPVFVGLVAVVLLAVLL